VEVDPVEAVRHLYLGAQNDSAEASCIVEMYDHVLQQFRGPQKQSISSNQVSRTLSRIKKRLILGSVPSEDRYHYRLVQNSINLQRIQLIDYVREWHTENREFVLKNPFLWQCGQLAEKYAWSTPDMTKLFARGRTRKVLLCDIMISYPTILTPTNTANLCEACARTGLQGYLEAFQKSVSDDDYLDSSWGDAQELWQVLLVESAKGGHGLLLSNLIQMIQEVQKRSNLDLTWGNSTGESPLHFLSFIRGEVKDVRQVISSLLSIGFNLDTAVTTRSWLPPFGIEVFGTPLQMAVRCGCLRTVDALVSCGANLNDKAHEKKLPIELAASTHRADIVSLLLQSQSASRNSPNIAIRAIGIPSKKGWFDRIYTASEDSHKSSVRSTRDAICNFVKSSAPLAINETQWLLRHDGAALIEAIRQGQRDVGLLAELINLDLGPSTPDARFSLLNAICALPKADVMRSSLLRMVFGDSPNQSSRFLEWTKEWPGFFEGFRYTSMTDPELNSVSIVHLWVSLGDVESIKIVKKRYRNSTRVMTGAIDGHGRNAVEMAIDIGSIDAYKTLRIFKETSTQEDLDRARSKPKNPILPILVSQQFKEQETSMLESIGKLHSQWRDTGMPTDEFIDALESYGNWLSAKNEARLERKVEHIFLTVVDLRIMRTIEGVVSATQKRWKKAILSNGVMIPTALIQRYEASGLICEPKPGSEAQASQDEEATQGRQPGQQQAVESIGGKAERERQEMVVLKRLLAFQSSKLPWIAYDLRGGHHNVLTGPEAVLDWLSVRPSGGDEGSDFAEEL
jgi:hypothetical protein